MYDSSKINKKAPVEEWMQGNVKVRIFSDKYTLKTPEDIEKTIESIKSIALEILNNNHEEKEI